MGWRGSELKFKEKSTGIEIVYHLLVACDAVKPLNRTIVNKQQSHVSWRHLL